MLGISEIATPRKTSHHYNTSFNHSFLLQAKRTQPSRTSLPGNMHYHQPTHHPHESPMSLHNSSGSEHPSPLRPPSPDSFIHWLVRPPVQTPKSAVHSNKNKGGISKRGYLQTPAPPEKCLLETECKVGCECSNRSAVHGASSEFSSCRAGLDRDVQRKKGVFVKE
jgi:hypothetical protein